MGFRKDRGKPVTADSSASNHGRVSRRYVLRRPKDELFLELEAIGFREYRLFGKRYLRKIGYHPEPLLIFHLPPQHFAETAIPVDRLPDFFSENELEKIRLTPSLPGQIVFRIDEKQIELNLDELLRWERFHPVLPQLDGHDAYQLSVPRLSAPATRIELPWGIELSPIADGGVKGVRWHCPVEAETIGEWAVHWSADLRDARRPGDVIDFEVFSANGFEPLQREGSPDTGNLVVTFGDVPGRPNPQDGDCATALSGMSRIRIAASLSRRFPYTGQPGADVVNTGTLRYESEHNSDGWCASAGYVEGRSIDVSEYRVTPRGGAIRLRASWDPSPGCALKGWFHGASNGRDHDVKVVHAGFLYPFGNKAELVVRTERAFVRDERGHFVAVLIQQAFVEVPQPNDVRPERLETPFVKIAVTTASTPPLDVPPSGSFDEYLNADFFLPEVGGQPYRFAHSGEDWAGVFHSSEMPLVFVSNKAASANGLIWEPGSTWNRVAPSVPCGPPEGGAAGAGRAIPSTGEGLRVVDQFWLAQEHRFADYGDALIALGKEGESGDTSQRVRWIEWARGAVPRVVGVEVAGRPFVARARSLKLRLQGIGEFSSQNTFVLGTYRDTRFSSFPILDPEPTAPPEIYEANLPDEESWVMDPEGPYVHLLEIRELVGGPVRPGDEDEPARSERIRRLYFHTSAGALPPELFASVTNEIRFGMAAGSESTGGLCVPDTHVSYLSRANGPSGDATFNPRRWESVTSRIKSTDRVDYAAFRAAHRGALDKQPYDASRDQAQVDAAAQQARTLMGVAALSPSGIQVSKGVRPALGLSVADLFGVDAEIIPGVSLVRLLEGVSLDSEPSLGPGAGAALSPSPTAKPPKWDFRVTGVDWILALIGNGPGQMSVAQFLEFTKQGGQLASEEDIIPLGIEGRLDWHTESFTSVDLGPVEFVPHIPDETSTRFSLTARAFVELGFDTDPIALRAKPPEITAKAALENFMLKLFGAIDLTFSRVAFELDSLGRKKFDVKIGDVRFSGPLEFINGLAEILRSLGSDSGMDLDVSASRVRISQRLAFPSTQGMPLFIGPAQVTNLVIAWNVVIPLRKRDVMAVGFALSSRERPLTIYVPPWYGGKAHVLLELTTRGIRLFEVSMEYGGLIPINWGVATGEASLTAGIFYMLQRDGRSGRVELRAFVRASVHLSIAGIIRFDGMIYLGMSYVTDSGEEILSGEAVVRVSIKIGFVRISYEFTARHEERQGKSINALDAGPVPALGVEQSLGVSAFPSGDPRTSYPLYPSGEDDKWEGAFERLLAGFQEVD